MNSRHTKRNNQVWRRRQCDNCNRTFTTREAPQLSFLRVKKREGHLEEYRRSKLLVSLLWSSDHIKEADVAFALADTIETKLFKSIDATTESIDSSLIASTAMEVLKNYDLKAFIKYVSNRDDELEKRDIKALLKTARD